MYELLLQVVDELCSRSVKLYNDQIEKELLEYVYGKMRGLIDKVVLQSDDKLMVVKDLSYIYLLTKKYHKKKIYIIQGFIDELSNTIKSAFTQKLSSYGVHIKKLVSNIYFLNPDDYKNILTFIRSAIKQGSVMQGRNYYIFIDRILIFFYKKLYRQVLSIVYDKQQSQNLLPNIDEVIAYVVLLNRSNLINQFNYLKNNCLLISVPLNNFMEHYLELESAILEKDLRALIKCRKDRNEVRNKIIKRK